MDVTLPALPAPDQVYLPPGKHTDLSAARRFYNAETLQAYATEAVMAERERCARIAQQFVSVYPHDPELLAQLSAASEIAAAIRSPKE